MSAIVGVFKKVAKAALVAAVISGVVKALSVFKNKNSDSSTVTTDSWPSVPDKPSN